MITVIHETLGYIILTDARFFMYFAAFQYHFMAYKSVSSSVYNTISVFQTSC